MSATSHPLTPTRRVGQVISVLMTPTPTIEVQIGGDPSVTVFVPFLDSYAPQANDYVVLLGNQGDYVAVGSVGSSLAAADASGPGSQTDYSAGATVCTATVNVTNGRKYRLGGFILGTQVTVQGNTSVRIMAGGAEVGPSTRLISRVLAVNELAVGYAAYRWPATSTGSVAFTLLAGTTAGAFRVSANGAQITVEDNGF